MYVVMLEEESNGNCVDRLDMCCVVLQEVKKKTMMPKEVMMAMRRTNDTVGFVQGERKKKLILYAWTKRDQKKSRKRKQNRQERSVPLDCHS